MREGEDSCGTLVVEREGALVEEEWPLVVSLKFGKVLYLSRSLNQMEPSSGSCQ